MEFQKVFTRDDGTVLIRCPDCMTEKIISSQRIPGKNRVKVKCTCGTVFGIQCEFRKKYRKQVNIAGLLLKFSQDPRWGKTLSESHETNIKPINCQICDISFGGIGLKVFDKINIQEKDTILVKFNLDNTASTRMEKKAIVRVKRGNYLGCEFSDTDKNDRALGFYFL